MDHFRALESRSFRQAAYLTVHRSGHCPSVRAAVTETNHTSSLNAQSSMMANITVTTFNVENLFTRYAALNQPWDGRSYEKFVQAI
jgi:hypothetical protein